MYDCPLEGLMFYVKLIMYERELISHSSTNTAQIEKSSASLRGLSLNS